MYLRTAKAFVHVSAYAVLAGTLLLAIVGFARVLVPLLRVPSQLDFGAYYVAARLLNADLNVYQASAANHVALGIAHIPHTSYIYPPFFAVLLRPLALLSYRDAEIVWFCCNVLLLGVVCLLLAPLLRISWRWSAVLFGASVVVPAVYDTWLLGQVSILLTALLLASLLLTYTPMPTVRRDVVAGLLLGLAVAIKLYPLVLVGVYLRHRRWRVLQGIMYSLGGAFVVGTLWGGGWSTTWYWFTDVLPATSTMAPFPANQSLRGVVERFFTATTFQVPVLNAQNITTVVLTPIVDSPKIALILVLGGSALILFVTIGVMLQRSAQPDEQALPLDFALATTVMCLVTPVVWDLYYVHLLFPLALLASVYRDRSGVLWAVALACLFLVLQRYWRYSLLYVQSPWFMMCGFLAVSLLWVMLLSIRRNYQPFIAEHNA
jgi:hypothetical protein